jgi:hypothetical protein
LCQCPKSFIISPLSLGLLFMKHMFYAKTVPSRNIITKKIKIERLRWEATATSERKEINFHVIVKLFSHWQEQICSHHRNHHHLMILMEKGWKICVCVVNEIKKSLSCLSSFFLKVIVVSSSSIFFPSFFCLLYLKLLLFSPSKFN